MSKKLLTRLLALTMCAGMILQPVISYAAEDSFEEDVILLEEEAGTEEVEEELDLLEDDSLPAISNVQLDGDVLSWDPVEGAVYYEVSLNGYWDNTYNTFIDLADLAAMYSWGISYGTYPVKLTAYGNGWQACSQPYETEYTYSESEYRIDKFEATSDIETILVDGAAIKNPVFSTGEDSKIRLSDSSHWVKIKEDGLMSEPETDTFDVGKWRYYAKFELAPEYQEDYKLTKLFSVMIDDKEWNWEGDIVTDAGKIVGKTYLSPVYRITKSEEGKTTITEMKVDCNPQLTFVTVDYGYCKAPSLIPETEGIKTSFVGWLYKAEDNSWLPYEEERFGVGYYKAQFSVEIDPEYKDEYILDPYSDCIMDGCDCLIDSRSYDADGNVEKIVFNSASYYSKFSYGNNISRIRQEKNLIYFDPFRGAAKYEIEIEGDKYYTEENFFDAARVYYDKDMSFRNYVLYITAVDAEMNPISNISSYSFIYSTLPPEGKKQITAIDATSNIADIFVEGEKYTAPTFTAPATVTIMNIEWQKYLRESFIPVRADDKDYFSEGQYRYRVLVHIGDSYSPSHEISEDLKLTVDGKEWTCEQIDRFDDGRVMHIYFLSPVLTIGEEPIEPEDPEDIEGGTWYTRWGTTYYETKDGELVTGKQVIDGETYLFNESGALQRNIFYTKDGVTNYFGSDGKMVKGWLERYIGTYYFDENGIMQTGFVDIEEETYYFNEKGHQVKSIWVYVGPKTYYIKADGTMAKSESIRRWGKKYSFDETGALMP